MRSSPWWRASEPPRHVRHGDPGEHGRVAEFDALGEVLKRRRHAAVHKLGVRETAQRPGPPFRLIEAKREVQGGRVLVATGLDLAPREMQVAAQVANFRKRATVVGCARRGLGLGERGEGIVNFRKQPIGGRAADQRP